MRNHRGRSLEDSWVIQFDFRPYDERQSVRLCPESTSVTNHCRDCRGLSVHTRGVCGGSNSRTRTNHDSHSTSSETESTTTTRDLIRRSCAHAPTTATVPMCARRVGHGRLRSISPPRVIRTIVRLPDTAHVPLGYSLAFS